MREATKGGRVGRVPHEGLILAVLPVGMLLEESRHTRLRREDVHVHTYCCLQAHTKTWVSMDRSYLQLRRINFFYGTQVKSYLIALQLIYSNKLKQ